MSGIKLKAIINKCNGQVNLNLPKKKIPKEIFERVKKGKLISIKFGDLLE